MTLLPRADAPATRLATKLAGAAAQAAPASVVSAPVKRILAAGRRGEEVVIPLLGRAWIELPGSRAWQEIEAAVKKEMRRLEVGELDITTAAQYQAELAIRVCAAAVRDPDDHAVAFGSLEEWGELDNDIIAITFHAFGDVRERLDPVATSTDAKDLIEISLAVKKKDAPLLRTFGVVKLSAWLASMADLLSTSPTPSSSSSDSPSERSTPSTTTPTPTDLPGPGE